MSPVSVYFHGIPDRDSILLGRLAFKEGVSFFAYDSDYLISGVNLSPLKLKFSTDLQQASRTPFNGLHGVFSDSLPDGWGLLLMDRVFRKRGFNLEMITPIDRLSYMGNRTMGALSYLPDLGEDQRGMSQEVVLLGDLAEQSLRIYQGTAVDVIHQLSIIGGSPGGARPKVVLDLKMN